MKEWRCCVLTFFFFKNVAVIVRGRELITGFWEDLLFCFVLVAGCSLQEKEPVEKGASENISDRLRV